MGTNYAEQAINQCLKGLRERVAEQAGANSDISVEATHLDIELYQPVGEDFTLDKLRAIGSDVQRLGMNWVDKVQRVRWCEMGARKHFFYFDARLYGKERQYVRFLFGLSPLDLVYYLETYDKHMEHQSRTLKDNVVTIYTLDGKGLIPIGAELEYRYDRLQMAGSEALDGRPFHPLTVTLMAESEELLRKSEHRKWVLTDDYGGVLYLMPAG